MRLCLLEGYSGRGQVSKWNVLDSIFSQRFSCPANVDDHFRMNSVLVVQMAMLALAFNWPRASSAPPAITIPQRTRTKTRNTLAILSVLSLLITMYRWPTKVPQPHRPGPRLVRAGIWTVHFGIDNEGRDSQRRMRDLIK